MEEWSGFTHHATLLSLAKSAEDVAGTEKSMNRLEASKLEGVLQSCLPEGSAYEFIVFSPPSSHGEVHNCELLLGFKKTCEWDKWVSEMFALEPGVKETVDVWLGYGRMALESAWKTSVDTQRGWAHSCMQLEPERECPYKSTQTQTTEMYSEYPGYGWSTGSSDTAKFIKCVTSMFESATDAAARVTGSK